MKFKNLLLSVLVLLNLFINAAAQTAMPNNGLATQRISDKDTSLALDDYFQKASGLGFSGAVLVVKDGNILLRQGYGWADVKKQIPIKPDTIFDIASGIKAFTATAVLQLEEQGKLNTSDLISKYLKDVPADKKDITIHHLLTHTSGLNFDYFYDHASSKEREIMRDREKYTKAVFSFPLAFKPGEGYLYSNTGFSLLAAIIEIVSGESYSKYLHEHLLKPAGITETGYYIPRDLPRVARGYNDGDKDYGYPWETQWDNKRPLWDLIGNSGMLTTIDDVYKWLLAIQGKRIVSQKSKDIMFQAYYPKSNYGFGWEVGQIEGKAFVFHTGDVVPQGWNTDFRWYKDDGLIVIVLSNRRSRAGSLRRYAIPQAVNITLFGRIPQLPSFAGVSAGKLRRLEGTYKLDSGSLFRVKSDTASIGNGKTKSVLIINGTGQQAIDLLFSANQTPDVAKLSLNLNKKTEEFIEALLDGNTEKLKEFLPENASAADELKRWKDFAGQNGKLVDLKILGTSPLNQQGMQTFVRLKFKTSTGVYKVSWRNGKLHEQEEARLQLAITTFLRKSFVEMPLNVPFLPQSETNFATYDLFKVRTVNVSFRNDENLIFHTKEGDVTAVKVKSP